MLSASSMLMLVHCEKAGLQTSSHPQNSASHLLGLQGLQQTSASKLRLLNKIHFAGSWRATVNFLHLLHYVRPSKSLLIFST